jgi:hypothetical protein
MRSKWPVEGTGAVLGGIIAVMVAALAYIIAALGGAFS